MNAPALCPNRVSPHNTSATPQLYRRYLVVDGNIHRPDLLADCVGFTQDGMVSEAMLPEIRTIACLIAAHRHTFDALSPSIFTEEADWFAARILVLGVRIFHLDVSLFPMLALANQRAADFAAKHHLPFQAAKAQMSLYAGRPHNMLIIESAQKHPIHDLGMVGNSLFLKENLQNLHIENPVSE